MGGIGGWVATWNRMAMLVWANVTIAVNQDADAPIFQRAHYGVVADWRDIIPALNEEIQCRGDFIAGALRLA